MREWLLEVWEADRKTILLVTHDVEEAVFLSDRVYVMSGRPGRVRATVDVPLRRPRAQELTTAPEFIALEQAVRAPLREARAGLV
jgi:ABC-type nitrate/sulfonate/bicarbonate transport system ATPase subunit